jgi:hypothetical protein
LWGASRNLIFIISNGCVPFQGIIKKRAKTGMRTFRLHLPDQKYSEIDTLAKQKNLNVDSYIQTALYLILHNEEMSQLLEKHIQPGEVLGRNEQK